MKARNMLFISALFTCILCFAAGCNNGGSTDVSSFTGQPGSESGTPVIGQPGGAPGPVYVGAPIQTTSHDNNILFFLTGLTGSDMSFTPTGHIVTGGQPWNGITSGPGYDNIEFNIDIFCGRKGSNEVGEWFRNWSSNNNGKSIDGHNASVHDSMNFAVSGVMILNGNSYNVCLAQYGYASSNIWVICGANFTNLQGTYSMNTPDGKYNFQTTNTDSAFNITLNN